MTPLQTRTPNNAQAGSSRGTEGGFSLLEVVVALAILTIGLLGVAAAIGYAAMANNYGHSITNTKLLAVSMLEQMETLRNTGNLTFGQIANVGQVDNSDSSRIFTGFQTGPQQVSTESGPDGIFGTADDLIDAGQDRKFGTTDDFVNPNFAVIGVTREIQISSLNSYLKKIQVTVNYSVGSDKKQLTTYCYLNDNSRSIFVP